MQKRIALILTLALVLTSVPVQAASTATLIPANRNAAIDWWTLNPSDDFALKVEIRSPRQAIITLTDSNFQEVKQKIVNAGEEYLFADWIVRFGENEKYQVSMQLHSQNIHMGFPDAYTHDFSIGSPLYENHVGDYTLPIIALHPHSPYTPADFDFSGSTTRTFNHLVTDDGIIWEVVVPPEENYDFSKETQFYVEYSMYNSETSAKEDGFQQTYEAAEVADMRNYGQEYDIGSLHTDVFSSYLMPDYVFGMTEAQADTLYFQTPTERYVTGYGIFEATDNISPGVIVHFKVEVYEIVCFDENGKITKVLTKIRGADKANGTGGIDYCFNPPYLLPATWCAKLKVLPGATDNDPYMAYIRSYEPDLIEVLGVDRVNAPDIDSYMEKMKSGELGWTFTDIVRHD